MKVKGKIEYNAIIRVSKKLLQSNYTDLSWIIETELYYIQIFAVLIFWKFFST